MAVEGNDVVGYALVCIEDGPDDTFPVGERYAELYSLSVAPQLRGRGIGTRLLDFVDEELARRAIDDLKVAVMVGNTDAERLYARLGWERVGVIPDYALWPDGGFVQTTFFYKRLTAEGRTGGQSLAPGDAARGWVAESSTP